MVSFSILKLFIEPDFVPFTPTEIPSTLLGGGRVYRVKGQRGGVIYKYKTKEEIAKEKEEKLKGLIKQAPP